MPSVYLGCLSMKGQGVFLIPPLVGMLVHCRVTPALNLLVLIYTVGEERHCESKYGVCHKNTMQCLSQGLNPDSSIQSPG